MRRGQPEKKHDEDERDRPFFFRGENENLAPVSGFRP
jgi:hypothetical protein